MHTFGDRTCTRAGDEPSGRRRLRPAAPARAEQRVRFFDKYRSYVINYNLGEDLVRQYVEARADADAGQRWDAFAALLSSPRLPLGLR